MSGRGIWCVGIGCIFMLLGIAWHLPAAEAKPNQAIASFLELGWQAEGITKQEIEAKFEKLQESAAGDARLYYAQVLICIHARRFEDAGQANDKILAFDDAYLPAWQTKIWLALLNKHYDIALVAMEKMGPLAGKAALDTTQKNVSNESARFLGMAFGFLAGPIGEAPATTARKQVEKKVLESLNDEQIELFKNARQTVLEKHISFVSNKEDSKEKAIADEEVEKQHKLDDIARRRTTIENDYKSSQSQRKELQTRLQDEIKKLTQADSPLASELIRVEATGNSILQQFNNLQNDLNRLEFDITRQKDPVARAVLQNEYNRLNRIRSQYSNNLNSVQLAVRNIVAKRNDLAARHAKVENEIGGEVARLDKHLAGLSTEERRLEGAERQARKPATGVSGKAQALGLTASALNTYEPYPLEREKARLLESLR